LANDPDHPVTGAAYSGPEEDLCLAFANTRYWRGRPTPVETLLGWNDLLAWLGANAGVPANLLAAAQNGSAVHPAEAQALLAAAWELRESFYHLFSMVADGAAVSGPELAALNRGLAATAPRDRLIRGDGGLGWAADSSAITLPILLAPVLWSAGDLLAHLAERRIRRCANDECLWLFLDHSKGGTRRWCDMNACGNRAKSKRHYLRTRHARS
jgi:predicted RNA-binding Zn ribbon-like protein